MNNKLFPGLTEDDITKIMVNPFYAITIDKTLCENHPLMITEEEWIIANSNLIEEIGYKEWLRNLLDVLKRDFVRTKTGHYIRKKK